MAGGCAREPWEVLADHWSWLGPPLRPVPQDMERLQRAWLASLPPGLPDRALDILLLGVTPEVAQFPWCSRWTLTALDASPAMFRAVWPGDAPHRRGVLGDWLQTGFADAAIDLVLTDAGLVALGSLERVAALSRELRRVLRPGGRVVVRHFIRPVPAELAAALPAAARAGEIRNFNELKLRLLMTMPAAPTTGRVSLPATLAAFNGLFPDRAALAAQLGCAPEIVATIDAYGTRDDGYVFASQAELVQCCQEFELALGPPGEYPLAGCCPVFCLTPRS
jgi:SAM-dependent methyltransferase